MPQHDRKVTTVGKWGGGAYPRSILYGEANGFDRLMFRKRTIIIFKNDTSVHLDVIVVLKNAQRLTKRILM